jgi:dCMP deaminase
MFLGILNVIQLRATCSRGGVSAIVTNEHLTTILSMGYNGTARGLLNGCDRETPGDCGCVHAEANALIKAPYDERRLTLISLYSPCADCAKLIINSSVKVLAYRREYRISHGMDMLHKLGWTHDPTNKLSPTFIVFKRGTP